VSCCPRATRLRRRHTAHSFRFSISNQFRQLVFTTRSFFLIPFSTFVTFLTVPYFFRPVSTIFHGHVILSSIPLPRFIRSRHPSPFSTLPSSYSLHDLPKWYMLCVHLSFSQDILMILFVRSSDRGRLVSTSASSRLTDFSP
jgi:hypothetical protein